MASNLPQSYECEYELERKQRIKENNERMRQIFGDTLAEFLPAKKPVTPRRARSTSPFVRRKKEINTPLRRNPKRSARSYHSEDFVNDEESSDDDITAENRLTVHWVGPLTKKRRVSGA